MAYFDATSLDTQNGGHGANLFLNAFDAWNQAMGWTLDGSPQNPGGTFNITTATAQQFPAVLPISGGLTIDIYLNGLNIPPLNGGMLVWTQGLLLNYNPITGAIVAPYYAMDTSTLSGLTCNGITIYCPPAYPYQYPDHSFYDQPRDLYFKPPAKQAFFDADAYLAIENPGKKTLELLDGVSYGYQNYVAATTTPEPPAVLLLSSGALLVWGFMRRKIGA